MHTDRQQQQAASRQGHTPFSTTPHPPPHHKELEMAAWLPIYSSASSPQRPATCPRPQRLLSSRGERGGNLRADFCFCFVVRAERVLTPVPTEHPGSQRPQTHMHPLGPTAPKPSTSTSTRPSEDIPNPDELADRATRTCSTDTTL
eukprot:scaffold14455_cov111-Isochrysis_galbana.AAC.1